MENKKINIRMIATTGILLAVEIILQLIGNYIPTTINPNLSLIPITIGAIMYGPIVGGFLGLINGAIILLSPSTNVIFMSINVGGTILTCLLKATLSGIIAGFVFKPFKNKHQLLGSIIVSILVPILNTLIYSLLWYFFFKGMGAFESQTTYLALFSANQFIVLINFFVEFSLNVILVPTLMKILFVMYKNKVVY